jgi:hypothetical protein
VRETGGKTADLELEVVGKSVSDVTQMINALNKSGSFGAYPKVQLPPTEGMDDVGFKLGVTYYPAPAPGSPRAGLGNQMAEGGR